MSFREDEISPELLRVITWEFRKFALSAYREDEVHFYAEAHLPRVKSFIHKRTGELVERKPHVHIVIPEVNLLSGQILNPFGKLDNNTKFLEAFQESINNKFGLASPKNHRRVEVMGSSEIIGRNKGDIFSGANTDLKRQILDEVIGRGIRNYEVFKAMLAHFGETRIRNKGKESEYQNVKPAGVSKGVNLKEYVFSREFIELDSRAKRARLATEAGSGYETARPPRPSNRQIEETLTEWHHVRSREIKYLNSGNVKAYGVYKKADQATRRTMLAEREGNFYSKHNKHNLEEQHHNTGGEQYAQPSPYKGQLGVRCELELKAPQRLDELRQARDRAITGRLNGRDVDNVVGQFVSEARERKAVQKSAMQPEMAELKRMLDARRLLHQLSQSHGLRPRKYSLTKGKDGGDRIQCGTRNLNVTDFMTKEMNLPWTVAEQLLRDCYAAQRGNLVEYALREPRRELWESYQAEGKAAQDLKRRSEWEAQRASEKERIAKIKEVFFAKKGCIQGDTFMSAAERKAAVSVARMERVQAEQRLRETKKIERDALKVSHGKPYAELYRDWLAEKAYAGNQSALAELRRMRRERSKPLSDHDAHIQAPAAVPNHDRAAIYRTPDLTYQVHRNGDVTYMREGHDVLRDAGRTVQVLQQDRQTIETGLRLAMAKFGSKLVLSGSQEFKERTARTAAEIGLRVDFGDSRLNQIRQNRRTELEAEKAREARVVACAQTAPASQIWYGWVVAQADHRRLLSSLGVELGDYDERDGKFSAKVSANVLQELQRHSEDFKLELTPLDDGLVASGSHRLGVRLEQATPAVLEGYIAYLRYILASDLGGRRAANAALDEAHRERSLRMLASRRLQSRADPDPPEHVL